MIKEYEERKTKEAILAKDADSLEWILSLKEQYDTGNTRAKKWLDKVVDRLQTETAKKIVKEILDTDSNDWWDKKDGPETIVTELKRKRLKHNL